MATSTALSVDRDNDPAWPLLLSCLFIRFSMRYTADHVYLSIQGTDGVARALHEMEQVETDRWYLLLRLNPDSYRYRYYAEHKGVTTYVRPCEVDEDRVVMDGMDAILIVPPSRERPA